MFDFRRNTLFCLEKCLSKHKMTIFSENLGEAMAPLPPPGYAYDCEIYRCRREAWRLYRPVEYNIKLALLNTPG